MRNITKYNEIKKNNARGEQDGKKRFTYGKHTRAARAKSRVRKRATMTKGKKTLWRILTEMTRETIDDDWQQQLE